MHNSKNNKHIENNNLKPSDLSRNYSGSTTIFTPEIVVNFIIDGINFILKDFFKKKTGLHSMDITIIDPSSGEMAFPLGLINYMKKNFSNIELQSWFNLFFNENLKCIEIDKKIYDKGKDHILDSIKSLIHTHYLDSRSKFVLNNIINRNTLEFNTNFEHINKNLIIVFGNPPFSVSSTSKNKWISSLVEDYKKTINRIGKKKIVGLKGIQDDYVKFIRYAQWVISDHNNSGILAYIVNNYFLEGDIFRGMRMSLLEAFQKIYIINLHGDPKKKPYRGRLSEENEKDENIFNIQTGVCIFIGVRKRIIEKVNKEKQHDMDDSLLRVKKCQVFYTECLGSKENKNQFLSKPFSEIDFQKVIERIDHEFIPISSHIALIEEDYNSYPYFPDIFARNIIGGQSLHDTLVTHPDKDCLEEILTKFFSGYYEKHEIIDNKFQRWVNYDGVSYHDARDWKISDGLRSNYHSAKKKIMQWNWRGFDRWWICFDENLMTKGSSSFSLMQFMLPFQNNIAIGISKVSRKASGKKSFFITNSIAESHFIEGGSGIGDYLFPLKIFNDNKDPIQKKKKRKSNWDSPLPANSYNFNPKFISELKKNYQIDLNDKNNNKIDNHSSEKNKNQRRVEDIFEDFEEIVFFYLFAILNTPSYQNQYQMLLKKDFPHIPFIKSYPNFYEMSIIGKEIAECFLFTSFQIDISIFPTNNQTNMKIITPMYNVQKQRIYFDKIIENSEAYNSDLKIFWIGNITREMWEYEIGGIYQLSSWLNYRKIPKDIQKSKKYKFTRAINKEELKEFLRICSAIRLILKYIPKLENKYKEYVKKENLIFNN